MINITNKQLFKGCLIASISHAIMTNVYPEFSYEQSWDGLNYSIQDSLGLRGTITFKKNYCIGAFRNENLVFPDKSDFLETILSSFPLSIVNVAHKETLQYLLIEKNGVIIPSVTSIFWADNNTFYYNENNMSNLKQDLTLINKNLLPEEDIIKEWQRYYDMNDDSIKLLKYLLIRKENYFWNNVTLDDELIKLIPGNQLLNECVESLSEMNIIIPQQP